jgi:transcriptional regulator with XRE-family HTH domain
VLHAIGNGMLEASGAGRRMRITRTEATRWKARRCPSGIGEKSWITLATARRLYDFKLRDLRALIAAGALKTRIGSNGPQRGLTYVPRHQCIRIREREGYTLSQAARRAHVTIAQMHTLLAGVNWRGAAGIPIDTVGAVIKRLRSQQGYTLQQAAKACGMPQAWVQARIDDGTVRVRRAPWDARRLYLTEPMFQRLLQAKRSPRRREAFSDAWLHLTQAADEAGVSTSTILRWAQEHPLRRRPSPSGVRYLRRSVRACARRHWQKQRFKRAVPPAWFQCEWVR